MDPLFERRELTRNVHIDSRHLKRNIQASLLAQLRNKYEGICVAEGYINQRSINIVEHSLGRINLIKGGLDYFVRFHADICMPHPGQVFRAPVSLKSKIGVHADITPIKALLPRDLHLGNGSFEDVEEKQMIEFEVIGSRFQQGDESIVVLAKLREIIKPAEVEDVPESSEITPLIAAPIPGSSGQDSQKRVVTVDLSSTKAPEETRRKRIIPKEGTNINETKSIGSA
jgi:DNA-directed RNA polymerase subunit E'/Rpb7